MYRTLRKSVAWTVALAVMLPLLFVTSAAAAIDGIDVASGVELTLTAKKGHTQTPDMGSQRIWGYALSGACSAATTTACTDDSQCPATQTCEPLGGSAPGQVQYPGPTLIVDQGDTVKIKLVNALDVPTSIVFPGQIGVAATGDAGQGILTQEASASGGIASYSFVASNAGTYLYHSGTQQELQMEMGLVGAIIVRPSGFSPATPKAYADVATSYDREYLFLLTEMDPVIHDTIEFDGLATLDTGDFFSGSFPVYWFINGRAAPDTLIESFTPLLPVQPYGALVLMHPGEKVLMRVIGAGTDQHPFHQHGNHCQLIARDGRVLSDGGTVPDLATEVFTVHSVPGSTFDCIFQWTGKDLGWDIYGTGTEFAHSCTDVVPADDFDDTTHEYCPDHGKPFPVALPDINQIHVGAFYSGSPFLGAMGFLPPDFTSFNPNAGFAFMWHSHTEKEIVNFDIFPGGMITMAIVEPIP